MERVALHVTVRLVNLFQCFAKRFNPCCLLHIPLLLPACITSRFPIWHILHAECCLIIFNFSNSLAERSRKELAQLRVVSVYVNVYVYSLCIEYANSRQKYIYDIFFLDFYVFDGVRYA